MYETLRKSLQQQNKYIKKKKNLGFCQSNFGNGCMHLFTSYNDVVVLDPY